MNYSYVMGIDNINKLKEENFEMQQFGNSFGVVFSDEKIKLFEEYICKSLKNGFWNEYLGKEKVLIPNGGHINSESGYDTFEEIVTYL